MDSISRRRFLKITSTMIGVAAAEQITQPGKRFVEIAHAFDSSPTNSVTRIPSYCDICFWKCGLIATVENGKLWKVEGNPEDPLSRGRLCPRGTGGIGAVSDPDRLRAPLIRKSVRGSDEFVEVTWDEALKYIADKMKTIKEKYGPESMALFSHGIGGNFLKHLMKAYGSPNITAPSFAQCRGPRDVGFRLTFGEDVGSPERTDIQNAKCIVLLGSHLGENMHNSQVQEFADAIEQGATIIVADPRYSIAASKAKWYLPIKPGTDIALLLAWMHVIVTEKLYDVEYVNQYGFGFDNFAAELAPYTPEWAYPETNIEPEIIRATARAMALSKPSTLVHPGRHATWYGDDAQRSRAVALLNALLGSWGRKGGFFTPVAMDLPGYPYPQYPHSTRGKVDNPNHKYPFAHETITTGIREATLTGKPYPVKGWLVYATNLLSALPNEAETIEAIKQLDLLVVVDVVPSEIAGWADVVLPESVYLERYDDLNVEWFREPFIALRQPVVKSPHDQKPNWWIAKQLANRLGLANYFPWSDIEDYLDHRLKAQGYSLADLKQRGIIRGEKQPNYFEEGVPSIFPTPSGKIEFYSLQLQQAGFDPVPKYTPPVEPPPGTFRLLYGRAPMHSFGRSQTNRILSDMMPENELWLNIDVAHRMDLKSGDYVRLKNLEGIISNRIRVKATERIRTDCVYMVHGFGHTSRRLRHAFGKGASDSQLITKYATDPLMGGTGMNVNFVSIEVEA